MARLSSLKNSAMDAFQRLLTVLVESDGLDSEGNIVLSHYGKIRDIQTKLECFVQCLSEYRTHQSRELIVRALHFQIWNQRRQLEVLKEETRRVHAFVQADRSFPPISANTEVCKPKHATAEDLCCRALCYVGSEASFRNENRANLTQQ